MNVSNKDFVEIKKKEKKKACYIETFTRIGFLIKLAVVLERFSFECRKTKTKVTQRPIRTKINITRSQ